MPDKKTKLFFALLVIVDIASLAAFVSLYSFTRNQINDTIGKTDQIKTEVEKQESVSLMQQAIGDGSAYESKLTDYFIQPNGVADFLKTLDGLVSESNLKSSVNSVSYESSSDASAVGAEFLDVKINVTGSWQDMQFFLQLLETYPLSIDIKSASLSQFTDSGKGKGTSAWSGDIEFTALALTGN